ncbi:MAG: carboxypeptidase regulatory-like domain-containing protein [Pyrinomonadaceae bacterium]
MTHVKSFFLTAFISILAASSVLAQSSGSIGGSVTDSVGAVIVGATVTAVSAAGTPKQAITNSRGEYSFTGLAPGVYTIKAIATGFGLYENKEVSATAGARNDLVIVLSAADLTESVEVGGINGVSNDAENNADATILTGKDIDALPDDPDELAAALQALAGASAGPGGGQIYIDGFTGGQLPSKESIREIRINSNPFSAEYERMGFGRIEILTRPGSDKFRGSVNGSFGDESLNSRNPFALNRAPTQQKRFGGNISGPIQKGKSSYGLDVSNNWVDNNTIINAQILDPTFNITPFRRDVQVPTKFLRISPRVDYAFNDRNTLVARYSFNRNSSTNQGLSETSLPARAYETSSREHEIRLTETMILNAKTVNETRFEFSDNHREQVGDNSIPTINVASSFIGGGASIGDSFNNSRVFDLHNFTSTSFGANSTHGVKFGGRLRHIKISDQSENNYAGTFGFSGFFGSDACDLDSDLVVSSIEQFRCKVTGVAGTRFNPTTFSITTGNPLAEVSQTEGALFVSDDWKVRPALLLSFGLRYEHQSNIDSNFNFGPRFGFAYSPGAGGARTPKMVIRGGMGVFYERFGENNTLQALRFNGSNQLNLFVNANDRDPVRAAAAAALLAQPVFTTTGVTNVPTAAQILAALPQSNTIRGISPVLQAPYSIQSVIQFERQLPARMTFSAVLFKNRSLHQIRSRNVNAPVCITSTNCAGAARPIPTQGNINVYESSGTLDQTRVNFSLNMRTNPKYTVSLNYSLGWSKSDFDGAGPAYAYDFTDEYSRSSFDSRHNLTVFSNFQLPWSMNASLILRANSGSPFNIVRGGLDTNGDGLLTERPTFGELGAACAERNLTLSFCDVAGQDPTAIIPRNYGRGPAFMTSRLELRKNFGFGKTAAQRTAGAGGGGRGGAGSQSVMVGGPGGGGGGGGPMMRMGGGGFGGGDIRRPYNLSVGVSFDNLLNTVSYNNPVGTLSSSRFGQYTSIRSGGFGGFGGGGGGAGPNRRIDLNMRFSF